MEMWYSSTEPVARTAVSLCGYLVTAHRMIATSNGSCTLTGGCRKLFESGYSIPERILTREIQIHDLSERFWRLPFHKSADADHLEPYMDSSRDNIEETRIT